jgi:TetR/AcrR family transcriptional regulator, transcriptional repressor for nem operon
VLLKAQWRKLVIYLILDQAFQKRYNGAMARTKEFDQEQALDAAMHLFWERGYEATSIQELVDATGVQRQSLYDTFGSKHEIFLQSLMRYQALQGHHVSELTSKHPKGGLPLIRAIFESCASQTVCDARGCFAANCAAELGVSDKAVAERVRIGRDGLEDVFKRCLEQARGTREFKSSSSVSALAQFLVNAFFGLRLIARTRPTKAMIDNVVSVTLAALR